MTADTPAPPAATFQIDSQTHGSGQDAQGNYVQGVHVYFTTGKGNTGVVFVPDKLYTVPGVQAAVSSKAATLDAVSDLTS